MAEPSASAPEENAIFGEVAQTGGGNWDLIGRKSGVKDPNAVDLSAPHRLKALLSIKIVRVATGCNSSHCVALSEGGVAYTWGRNEHGQLGHGTKSKHMNVPAKVSSLSSHKIVEAATGRNHTVFVTSEGLAFSCGMNKQGQLGQGTSSDMAKTPALMKLPTVHIVNAACGADFTMLLDRSGQVWSCGHPEYGALGHGTDNQTVAANKFIFTAQSTPKVIQALVKQKIKKIACGTSHTVVLDDKNTLFSWGFNGYGRLGHGNTADEMTPKQIKNVTRGGSVPIKLLACGGETTLVATVQNELYMCGRVKKTGDSWLALRAHQELNGWFVRSMSGGPGFMTVSADESVISWGTAFYGELGYGPDGAKSSVNPKKIDSLEGMITYQVSCGAGHTLFLIDTSKEDRLKRLPIFDPPADETPEPEPEESTGGESDQPKAGKGRGGGKKKAVVQEVVEEEEEDISDEEEEPVEDSDEDHDGGDDDDDSDGPPKKKAKSSNGRGGGGGGGKGKAPPAKKATKGKPAAAASKGKTGPARRAKK